MKTTTRITGAGAPEAGTTTEISRAGRLGPRGAEAAGTYVGELFAEHGRMVLGLCRLLLRDPVEAEDAAQQVFVSAHQAVLRGSRPRDDAAWLAAIARNECRTRIRARMREPLALPELPSDLPDPLVAAIRAADLHAAWSALGTLPRRQRNALVLRELGGLSYHELGRALGVSDSAVESLLFRARRRLRAVLAGANAAALPVALRDELMRLIPGFDPGSAGAVARVAALPVAWKLAGAAVGVGVIATGAGGLHEQAQTPRAAVARPAVTPVVGHVTRRHARSQTAVASSLSSHRRRGREAEQEAEHRGRHRGRGRGEEQEGRDRDEGPGPGPTATTTAPGVDEPDAVAVSSQGPGGRGRQLEADEDDSGSGNSGHGGGGGGGGSGGGGGPDLDDSGHGGHSGPG